MFFSSLPLYTLTSLWPRSVQIGIGKGAFSKMSIKKCAEGVPESLSAETFINGVQTRGWQTQVDFMKCKGSHTGVQAHLGKSNPQKLSRKVDLSEPLVLFG